MTENFKGIDAFIDYKNKVEKVRKILTTEPRLITIDGVDGSGKSTIAKLVFEKLKRLYGDDHVVWADITNLSGSPKQDRLKKISKMPNIPDERVDRLYIAGVNRAYEEIIVPALESGKIVVVDRSELDLLRYAIDLKDDDSFQERLSRVEDGTMTHKFWAGNRIFIEGKPEEVWHNLNNRGPLSKYDPQSLQEVIERLEAQHRAEQELLSLKCDGRVNVVRKENRQVSDKGSIEIHLDDLTNDIIEDLNLGDNILVAK